MAKSRAAWVLLPLLWLFWVWSAGARAPESREFWYPAALNHQDANLTVLIRQVDDVFYVRHLDLALLNLALPDVRPQQYHQEHYYPIHTLPGYRVRVDHLQRRVHFVSTQLPHLAPPPAEDLLLTVTANGRLLKEPQYLRFEHGELILPESTMRAMGIVPPKIWKPELTGDMPLHAVAGENFVVDYTQLSLHTRLLPELLETSDLNVSEKRAAAPDIHPNLPVSRSLAVILNYDILNGYSSEGDSWQSGLYDVAIGSGNSQCRSQHFNSSESGWRRFSTSCQKDWPEQSLSAVLGDATGGAGPLTQPWRFGGIRIGSDFSLQPTRLTIPTQAFSGIVDQPATLEIWVDEALSLRTQIPAGPFNVHEIPLRTGAGEVRALIKPLHGAHQYLVYDFYNDRSILAPGLSAWSLEAGKLQNHISVDDNSYRQSFVAGNFRRGINSRLTLGAGVQATENLHVANLGAAFTIGQWAAIEAAVAVSRQDEQVSEPAWRARLSHQSHWFSASYLLERNPANYTELAWLNTARNPRERRVASFGVPLSQGLAFNYHETYQRFADGTDFGFRSAGVTIRLGQFGSLRVSASRSGDTAAETFYGAHLSLPLGRIHSASVSARREGRTQWQELSLQKSIAAGPGFGYRVDLANSEGSNRGTVDFHMQNTIGRVSVQGSKFNDSSQGSIRASGSVLMSREGLDLSRRAQGSYAVVDVGVENVPVYHGGQLKAYSNKAGLAVVSGLRPFEQNAISIRAEDVPVDVQPETLKAVVRPGRRELMKVKFGFRREQYYVGRLTNDEGEALPAGARINFSDQGDSIIGENGEFFISSYVQEFDFDVTLPTGTCTVAIVASGKGESMVKDLGTIVCKSDTSAFSGDSR